MYFNRFSSAILNNSSRLAFSSICRNSHPKVFNKKLIYGCRINPFNIISNNFHATSAANASKRDFYEVLGLQKGASKAEIKKSYFQLAKKYHPDVNKEEGAEAKFREITEAYEVLEDDKKKQMYDNYGHAGVDENAGFGGGDPFGGGVHWGGAGGHDAQTIFDMFEQAFGGGGFGGNRGRDAQTGIRVSFFEAVKGCSRDIEFDYYETVPVSGKGGQRKRVHRSKKVSVDIPPGVDTGVTLRMPNNGIPSPDGKHTGDLLIQIEVTSDPYFKRSDNDIHVEVPISLNQAILGGTVDVLTVDGMIEMKIAPGTQPSSKLLLRGKGMPYLNASSRRGNQYVHINVKIPKPNELTEKQKECIVEYQKEEIIKTGGDPEESGASCGVKMPFSINEAWRRVKSFMQSDDTEKNKKKTRKKKSEN